MEEFRLEIFVYFQLSILRLRHIEYKFLFKFLSYRVSILCLRILLACSFSEPEGSERTLFNNSGSDSRTQPSRMPYTFGGIWTSLSEFKSKISVKFSCSIL